MMRQNIIYIEIRNKFLLIKIPDFAHKKLKINSGRIIIIKILRDEYCNCAKNSILVTHIVIKREKEIKKGREREIKRKRERER